MNPKLVGFSGNKEGKITLQDSLFTAEAIQMLTGNAFEKRAKDIQINEKQVVTSSKITLSKTPKGAIGNIFVVSADGGNGQEFTLGTPATNANEFSINGKEITFHSSVQNGTTMRIYYTVTTANDAKTMRVTADAFSGTFKAVGQILVRDAYDGKDYPAIVTIPRAKVEDNWSMSLSVDGDPSPLDLPIEMLKDPVTDEMWLMTVYNEADIV